MSDYKPIPCGLHEQYQYAVLEKRWLNLVWQVEMGDRQSAVVLPKDVFTQNKQEFIRVAIDGDWEVEIRLDHIRTAHWAQDGQPLG